MRVVEGVADVGSVEEFVADLGAVSDEHDCAVQAFDADYVADRDHLEAAVTHANRSVARGVAVADERAVEILLYAAGRRQIRDALEMGVSEGEQAVVVVVDGSADARDTDENEADAAADVAALLSERETLGGDAETLAGFFDVSDAELDAAAGDLAGVVRERVALLDVEK
ncbi:KEOPS complex subunit Cgi121 [Halobacterium zhouii]|uniref:KEOPS complex subunit Cgi121 n=1 Tax=Halobacterium zhouii TaxID=2902624 RepID=UPI001E32B185|nr:KEOPS complex subunit Cgi121 [Halobacterium zhouii]